MTNTHILSWEVSDLDSTVEACAKWSSMPSSTVEDYIKHIYLQAEEIGKDTVPMGRVSEALGVVPGTATTMVKALSDAALVVYEPRIGVALTQQGKALALHVLRRHRLIEQFLVEVLGFDWSEVHVEAEQLEHAISEPLLQRIDTYLGHPAVDPHGDPIPRADGTISRERGAALVHSKVGDQVTVERITDQDSRFLRYVSGAGLAPGTRLTILAYDEHAGTLTVGRENRPDAGITLGLRAAERLEVRREGE